MFKLKAIYFIVFLILIFLLGLFLYFEIRNSHSYLDKIIDAESITLINSIRIAVEISIIPQIFLMNSYEKKCLHFPSQLKVRKVRCFIFLGSNVVFNNFEFNEFYCFSKV